MAAQGSQAPDPITSAAGHPARRVPHASPDAKAAEVRAELTAASFDSVHDVAVLDGSRLVGLVPIEALMSAAPDMALGEIMDRDPPAVLAGTDPEEAAWKMIRHGETSIAVVDEQGRFAGLIPPRRMLAVLLGAHDEDLARLGGYLSQTSRARLAAEESVSRRLWHRLPWLMVGLVGAMLSAVILAGFEEQLSSEILLSFFVPAVVYMSGAVGTQTVTVLIRGLSVGVDLRSVVLGELITGAIVGLLIGAVFFPFALLAWGETDVAAAVALALLGSCATATLAAMGLPFAFQRLGLDPAFGSGPLVTVIQDLLSIAVYLAIATTLVV